MSWGLIFPFTHFPENASDISVHIVMHTAHGIVGHVFGRDILNVP